MKQKKKIVIFSFTRAGSEKNFELQNILTEKGCECLSFSVAKYADREGITPFDFDIKEYVGGHWGKAAFVFIGAAGIAIRYIAPFVKDKFTDSPILSMDEKGKYIIPLLSGHMGGAVKLAKIIADETGAEAVISTATDINDKFAVDVFARKNHLYLTNRECAKKISAALLDGDKIGVFSEMPIEGEVPEGLQVVDHIEALESFKYGIVISESEELHMPETYAEVEDYRKEHILVLVPRNLYVGIGCRKDTEEEKIETQLQTLLEKLHLSRHQIRRFASIELKKDEAGIVKLAEKYHVPFQTFSAQELKQVPKVSQSSAFVNKVTGVDNVCERAAVCSAQEEVVLQEKICMDSVTFAIVKKTETISF